MLLLSAPGVWWFKYGEWFLSESDRVPEEVLVLEGWVGLEGVQAAVAEFKHGGYRYLVASGGISPGTGWEEGGWSYAERAGNEIIRLGILKDKVIIAPASGSEDQRTYEAAVAVWNTLKSKGIRPNNITVFTLATHARRSRLVFAKVFHTQARVGVVGWIPDDFKVEPWWRSSERARELIVETAGYAYEGLLNSGRKSNSPD
jgi:hypothetical protein